MTWTEFSLKCREKEFLEIEELDSLFIQLDEETWELLYKFFNLTSREKIREAFIKVMCRKVLQ